jgi:hypothetical protein
MHEAQMYVFIQPGSVVGGSAPFVSSGSNDCDLPFFQFAAREQSAGGADRLRVSLISEVIETLTREMSLYRVG